MGLRALDNAEAPMPVNPNTLAMFEIAVSLPPYLSPGGLLYHYTDSDGLIGILTYKAVRATHCRYLNDRQETIAGTELIQEVALALSRDATVEERFRGTFGDWAKHHEKVPTHSFFQPFIASFTENEDQLSQWRAYADNGAGYSLGFDLKAPPTMDRVDITLRPCVYEATEFRDQARTAFLEVAQKLSQLIGQHANASEDSDEFVSYAMKLLSQHAATLVPTYKSHGFKEEREWRLIAVAESAEVEAKLLKVRPGARGIRPYLDLQLCAQDDLLPLHSVRVGPTQDPEAGVNAARLYLRSRGYPDTVQALESVIPYRS
jgi:hypothetical protein